MKTSEILKRLRISNNLSRKDVAYRIGVTDISVRCWEIGTKNPSMTALISLSRLYSVSIDFIAGVENAHKYSGLLLNEQESALISNYRSLDECGKEVVEKVCDIEFHRCDMSIYRRKSITRMIPRYFTPSAAGSSVPIDGDDFEMIQVDRDAYKDADFAVIIRGDSMNPYIHDGDTVYVKKGIDIIPGDVGIFCVDGAMYCKQYYIDEDGNTNLLSANPDLKHTNIKINAESGSYLKCYGKVLMNRIVPIPNYIFVDGDNLSASEQL